MDAPLKTLDFTLDAQARSMQRMVSPRELEARVERRESSGLVGVGGVPAFHAEGVALYLGDCLEIAPLLAPASCNLLLADPPYGMGKEKDGVMNDNLYGAKLDAFLMAAWRACRPALADNASAYVWGNAEDLWRLWYRGGLEASERLTMRNEIVWTKDSGQGMESEQHRMFATASERALFFMLGEQGFNNNVDNYWEGWEPVRKYLADEMAKLYALGWTRKRVDVELFGCTVTSGGMVSHYIGSSQWGFITEKNYRALQRAANGAAFKREHDDLKREHDDLKREHDDLKREFYATRAYFDNAHQSMTDVWHYGRVTGAERHGHATPKPVAMMARCVKSSCPPGGTVLDPFTGTAPTAIACIRTGRKFVGIEKDPVHFEAAVARIQKELSHGDFFLGRRGCGAGEIAGESQSAAQGANGKHSDTAR